jgi:hypothetical protein
LNQKTASGTVHSSSVSRCQRRVFELRRCSSRYS